MKKLFNICVVVVLLGVSLNLTAQKSQKENATKKKAEAVSYTVSAFLGRSGLNGGLISKKAFDSLLRQGLTAKDSMGNMLKVEGFTFGYGERNLYEDSIGNFMVLTDYYSEFCPGDTMSPAVANNIFNKTKAGDTAYFDQIRVSAAGKQLAAKPMRFVLTK